MANEITESEDESGEYRRLKAEGVLPTKTVGIESLKESASVWVSPHRRIFTWFARRPTATTRLAILSSLLPIDTDDEELHRLMCIGPKEGVNGDLEDYIVKKYASKDQREGSIEEHFGYEYPHKNVPSEPELKSLHDKLRDHWDGSLPTVLDPTAGGGTIPLEAMRYGLPTISNELNPVAWLLNKVILEYAPSQKSLSSEVDHWASKIQDIVADELEEFFPRKNGVPPNNYFRAYSIECPSCGMRIPISNRWWFNRRSGIAIKPVYDDGLSFEVVDSNKEDIEFNPGEGTVKGGDAECPHCGVVTERSDIVKIFRKGEFRFEVCGVRYEEKVEGTKYHSPTEDDYKAIRKAEQKIESDLTLSTLLRTNRYEGYYDRAVPYGVDQWRDVFSPRQLLSHAIYAQAFNEVKETIRQEYEKDRAEAILTLLSFISIKLVQRNSRLEPIKVTRGSPGDMLGNNGFFFQWHFGESNLMAGSYSYKSERDNVMENYEQLVEYVEHVDSDLAEVHRGDAAELSMDDESIESVVIDPPYGDNIMYGELSDVFFVWFKEYLGDIFQDAFQGQETDKESEAVENPVIASPTEDESKGEVARQRYEDKMNDIFSEIHRVLEPGGVVTIYFTDKEVEAWDSLTMSIIRSGFTVTATHTITSEMPQRIGQQQDASADSTLLLTCRKPSKKPNDRTPTLWRDIQQKTKHAAQEKANELFDSDYNLTKTDTIISAFGPTLRVFTENYPVVDDKDNTVRPREALREARTAVTEVLISRELEGDLAGVDSLSTWYVLSWLVYESESIPYDEARQLGLGVGVQIDDVKRDTKIWKKSGDTVVLASHSDRVQSYDELESGEKRRKRKYPVDPRDLSFDYQIDTVHACLSVLDSKGGDFTWNWINERNLQNQSEFITTIQSLLQVVDESHKDYDTLLNLASGETGDLLDIDRGSFIKDGSSNNSKTTLDDF